MVRVPSSGVRLAREPTICSGVLLLRMIFFFKIGEAFHEENRRDDGREEIIEHHGFVEIKAFERGFVENQRRPLRHMSRLCIRKERDRRRSFAAMLRPG